MRRLNRTGIVGDLIAWDDEVYGTSKSVFAEMRERAVRMIEERGRGGVVVTYTPTRHLPRVHKIP